MATQDPLLTLLVSPQTLQRGKGYGLIIRKDPKDRGQRALEKGTQLPVCLFTGSRAVGSDCGWNGHFHTGPLPSGCLPLTLNDTQVDHR